jgi:hypothetical protein
MKTLLSYARISAVIQGNKSRCDALQTTVAGCPIARSSDCDTSARRQAAVLEPRRVRFSVATGASMLGEFPVATSASVLLGTVRYRPTLVVPRLRHALTGDADRLFGHAYYSVLHSCAGASLRLVRTVSPAER